MDSDYKDIIETYKLILDGTLSKFPLYTWSGVDAKHKGAKCIQYLFDEYLHFTEEDIINNISVSFFSKYKLSGMLTQAYKNNIYEAISSAYPNKFKQWQFIVASGYWTIDNARESIKWLIEEKLKLSSNEEIISLTLKDFKKYGLITPLKLFYKSNPIHAFVDIYPEKFKIWNAKDTPNGYWTKENAISAIHYLVEDKLHLSDDDIKQKWNNKLLIENKLGYMMKHIFNNNTYAAIDAAYPGKFKYWEISRVPSTYWNDNTIKDAVKWLIEENLKFTSLEEAKEKILKKDFYNNGLSYIIRHLFKGDVNAILNFTYKE